MAVDGGCGGDREAEIVKYVLLVCSHNPERSRMAQAFFERHAGEAPRSRSHAVEAKGGVRSDLTDRKPRKLSAEIRLRTGTAITLDCEVPSSFGRMETVEDWEGSDPADKALQQRRAIQGAVCADGVEAVLNEVLQALLGRLARQVRLEQLLPPLVEEFAGKRAEGEIRACADAILGDYDEASVGGNVMTIARRRARKCLRGGECTALGA